MQRICFPSVSSPRRCTCFLSWLTVLACGVVEKRPVGGPSRPQERGHEANALATWRDRPHRHSYCFNSFMRS
jgi:hypothetical protein